MSEHDEPTLPRWATVEQVDPVSGQVNAVEPPESRKDGGWRRGRIPTRQFWNWLHRQTHLYLVWLKGRVDALRGDLDTHIADEGAVHGATTAATGGQLQLRQADGRGGKIAQAIELDDPLDKGAFDEHVGEQVADAPHGMGEVAALSLQELSDVFLIDQDSYPINSGFTGLVTAEAGGQFNAGQTVTLRRQGNHVSFATIGALTHSSASQVLGGLIIPAGLRPASPLRHVFMFRSDLVGVINIGNGGDYNVTYFDPATGDAIAQTSTAISLNFSWAINPQ